MNFLHYEIIGAPKKIKHQPRPLVRSSSLKFGKNFWNLSHETVPLKGHIWLIYFCVPSDLEKSFGNVIFPKKPNKPQNIHNIVLETVVC